MKKICTMLMAVSMGVCPLQTLTAYSIDETPQIIVGDVEASAGESVVVPISLANNSGIIGANFGVSYDTSKLKLVDAVDEKLLTNATFSTNSIENVPFNIMFDDYRTENYTEDGVLVSLHFEVLEDAESGFTPVEVTVKEDSFIDADIEYVAFESVSGGVNITGSETPQIVVESAEATAGESVAVPISLVNNSGIIGANFGVSYDTSKLKLVDAVDEKLLTNATFSTNDIENVPFNIMFDDSCTENYTEDGVLVSLYFEVLEDAESGFTPVEVTVKEDSFVDADVEYVSFETVSGGVEISGNTVTEPSVTLEYQLGDVNGDGMTDASDASQILSIYAVYSTGGTPEETEQQLLSADVNGDNMVDASDASTVLAYYAYLSTGGTVDIETFMATNAV